MDRLHDELLRTSPDDVASDLGTGMATVCDSILDIAAACVCRVRFTYPSGTQVTTLVVAIEPSWRFSDPDSNHGRAPANGCGSALEAAGASAALRRKGSYRGGCASLAASGSSDLRPAVTAPPTAALASAVCASLSSTRRDPKVLLRAFPDCARADAISVTRITPPPDHPVAKGQEQVLIQGQHH